LVMGRQAEEELAGLEAERPTRLRARIAPGENRLPVRLWEIVLAG
jgi:hypothetical protein